MATCFYHRLATTVFQCFGNLFCFVTFPTSSYNLLVKDSYCLGSHMIHPHVSADYSMLFLDLIIHMSLEQSNKEGCPSELNVISKRLCLSLLSFSKNRNENIILSSKLKIFECSRIRVVSFLSCSIPPTEFDIGKYLSQSYFVSTWAVSTGRKMY